MYICPTPPELLQPVADYPPVPMYKFLTSIIGGSLILGMHTLKTFWNELALNLHLLGNQDPTTLNRRPTRRWDSLFESLYL